MQKRASRLPQKVTRTWPAAVGVICAVLIVFWPVVSNQFVNWDDDKNFLTNPDFRGLGPSNLRWMFTTFHLGHYHPLTWLSFGLDYTIWGLDPAGYHLTNLILHAVNAVLFYVVALRLCARRVLTAALASLFFALHPLRVESVAWASERRDVLSGLFFLASVLAYLRANQEGPRRRWMAVSLAAFAAALLSKAIVVTLPMILLLLDLYPLRRGLRWGEKLPYFLMAAAAGIAALARQQTGVPGFAGHVVLFPGLRLGLSLYGLAFYVGKTLAPFGLYPQYVLPATVSPWDAGILAGAGLVAVLTAAAILWRQRYPALLVAWTAYAVSLLPVLSIFRVDPQQFAADHHTYLATLGLALLASAALTQLPARKAAIAGALIVLGYSVLSRRQIGVWHDPLTLWTYALAGAPDSVIAHNNLGEALAAGGRLEEAAQHFTRAIQIKPAHVQARYNLARIRQQGGKLEEAVEQFQEALRLDPSFAAAHNDLANCLVGLGRKEAALEQYRLALRKLPDFADAHYNLANLLQSQGELQPAISHYEAAVRLKPGLADAHNNWGVALDGLGRSGEAIEHYRRALVLDPQNADAHNNLGLSLERQGKKQEALAHYREAVRLNPSRQDARANLKRMLQGGEQAP